MTREGEEEAKTIFVYRSCDGCDFEVADEVVLESRLMKAHYIKDKKNEPEKKKHIYRIPGITADSMALVISCCKKFMVLKSSNTSYNDINRDLIKLDIVTTFNLIQAAHFLKIQWLMNLSCHILLIKSRQSRKALMLFNYVLKDMQHSEDNSPLRIDILLRSRQKDTFINDSDFLQGHLSPFVLNQLRFVTRGKRIFKEHWRKIKESECYIDLLKSIRSFEELIRKDPRLAYHITATVFRCLIKILDKTRYNSDNRLDIQRLILSILSRARYDVCGDVIKQKLIPHLVQFVSDPENGLAIWAVIALTHIAYTFPDHIKEIVDEGALEAAYKALHNHLDVYWRMEQLAKFLATVCRAYSFTSTDCLPSDKVEKILTILDTICQRWSCHYRMVHTVTCYTLLYLSYEKGVTFKEEVWNRFRERLVDYISIANDPGPGSRLRTGGKVVRNVNSDQMLAGSALGVVGHIMRWGNQDQMQSLTEVPRFWGCLRNMLCSKLKKFQKEACQIISNMTARRKTLIKDVVGANVEEPLCCLLDKGGSDEKMEAAWAIFNIIYCQDHLFHMGGSFPDSRTLEAHWVLARDELLPVKMHNLLVPEATTLAHMRRRHPIKYDDIDKIILYDSDLHDEVIAFPLYEEAIRFASHEESMVRTAVRALTLNVYHVGDESVNKYVASRPHADYFLKEVEFFRDQCISLNELVANTTKSSETTSKILSAVDDIEDNLYYFSDVISAGIPDVGRLITDKLLNLLIFPYLLPSLRMDVVHEIKFDAVASLYVLCCILRIVKIKDLANTVAAALFCRIEAFTPSSEASPNGCTCGIFQEASSGVDDLELDCGSLRVIQNSTVCLQKSIKDVSLHDHKESHLALRDALLSYITIGDDVQVMGSINVMATLLQTKELDESMLDALGILPERKKHKKLLLQALVGEGSGEEQLFSAEGCTTKEGSGDELTSYIDRLKNQYGVSCSCPEVGESPRVHKFQVFDALVSLFCRSDISAETLWDGGWLLRQLLPYRETEFNNNHLNLLKDSYMKCNSRLIEEFRGSWPDLLITVLCDEWRKCKRAIEASSPRKELKCILLPQHKLSAEDQSDSSLAAGERLCELVKVFVLFHQLRIFSVGRPLPDQPPINPPIDFPEKCRAKTAVDAVPCKIAFERGKERHFFFLAISLGSSGWVVLAEELTSKVHRGVVRIAAPLAGCNPRVDEKHSRWLHLRIRPTTFPLKDAVNFTAQGKTKSRALVDGRWTLAFRDESSCKSALSMIVEELNLQSREVERRLRPLLDFESDLERAVNHLNSSDLNLPHPRSESTCNFILCHFFSSFFLFVQ